MKYIIILLLAMYSCSTLKEKQSVPWPKKIANLDKGLIVTHSADTVYATINTKDPDKRGKYQLQFTTSVSSKKGNIEIIEFGAYLLTDNNWEFVSIFDRPFNNEEFAKWYNCEDGIIDEGKTFSDNDNWLRKTNKLDNKTIVSLWYYIGVDDEGNKVVGAREIVGVAREK